MANNNTPGNEFVPNPRDVLWTKLRDRSGNTLSPREHIRACLADYMRLLGLEEGALVELQALDVRRADSFGLRCRSAVAYARSLDSIVELLSEADDENTGFLATGLYVIGNELREGVEARGRQGLWTPMNEGTSDRDVVSRRELYVDCDPERPRGVQATPMEMKRAVDLARLVHGRLFQILGDDRALGAGFSGSGVQLHIGLANIPKEATDIIHEVLLCLSALHTIPGAAKVDTAVHDAKRIGPAWGTMKRKGEHRPDLQRPWRRTTFVAHEMPQRLTFDELKSLRDELRRDVPPDKIEGIDRELRRLAQTSSATPKKTSGRTSEVWERCNAISIRDVATRLGLDPENPTCPWCGATKGCDLLDQKKGLNILKCQHETCNQKSAGPVTLVAKVAFSVEDAKGENGRQVLQWFAREFGIEIPARRRATVPIDGGPGLSVEEVNAQPPLTSNERDNDAPEIYITTNEMEVNDAAIAALSRDDKVYARGNRLVRVLRSRIDRLPVETLREHLASAARWFSANKNGVWVHCHPPAWSIQAVDKRGQWDDIRELAGIVTCPTLLPDGRLLTQRGFDISSGLLYLPEGDWNIPSNPTRDDGRKAVEKLRDVVAQFPWQEPIDFAAWLAELLTVVGRHAIRGPYPMFAHSANIKGSGKGKLAQIIAVIATGETVPEGALPDDEGEREKRMTGISVSGRAYVLFDEAGEVAGPILQMVATSRRISGRILGETGDYTGPWDAVVVFAANNLQIGQDMIRRVVPVRLLSPLEKPWERQDLKQKNLLAWVAEHRCDLLTAALVILRSYVVAGRPNVKVGALGSYEDWTALVASALVWLGLPDITKAVAQDDADMERATILALMTAWRDAIGIGKAMLASEVRSFAELGTKPKFEAGDAVSDVSLPSDSRPSAELHGTFKTALCAFCPPRPNLDLPSAAAIGHALKRVKNRVVALDRADHVRFISSQDAHTKLHGWTLERAEVAEVAQNQPPQTEVCETKSVAEVAEVAEVYSYARDRSWTHATEHQTRSSTSIQTPSDLHPQHPQPPQGQSGQEVASAEVEKGQPPQPTHFGPTSAPSLRCRAAWATLDLTPDGERLTVALRPTTADTDSEANIFHFRVGARDHLQAVLDLHGWSGDTNSDGALVGFSNDVHVSTREHAFDDGHIGLIVTACEGVIPAMAS